MAHQIPYASRNLHDTRPPSFETPSQLRQQLNPPQLQPQPDPRSQPHQSHHHQANGTTPTQVSQQPKPHPNQQMHALFYPALPSSGAGPPAVGLLVPPDDAPSTPATPAATASLSPSGSASTSTSSGSRSSSSVICGGGGDSGSSSGKSGSSRRVRDSSSSSSSSGGGGGGNGKGGNGNGGSQPRGGSASKPPAVSSSALAAAAGPPVGVTAAAASTASTAAQLPATTAVAAASEIPAAAAHADAAAAATVSSMPQATLSQARFTRSRLWLHSNPLAMHSSEGGAPPSYMNTPLALPLEPYPVALTSATNPQEWPFTPVLPSVVPSVTVVAASAGGGDGTCAVQPPDLPYTLGRENCPGNCPGPSLLPGNEPWPGGGVGVGRGVGPAGCVGPVALGGARRSLSEPQEHSAPAHLLPPSWQSGSSSSGMTAHESFSAGPGGGAAAGGVAAGAAAAGAGVAGAAAAVVAGQRDFLGPPGQVHAVEAKGDGAGDGARGRSGGSGLPGGLSAAVVAVGGAATAAAATVAAAAAATVAASPPPPAVAAATVAGGSSRSGDGSLGVSPAPAVAALSAAVLPVLSSPPRPQPPTAAAVATDGSSAAAAAADDVADRVGSRVQLSVSVLGHEPPPPVAGPPAAAAVGVPVLVMRSNTTDGVVVPNMMVMGRPATEDARAEPAAAVAAAAAAAGLVAGATAAAVSSTGGAPPAVEGYLVVPEGALSDVDVVANISIAHGGGGGGGGFGSEAGSVRRRHGGTSGGSGAEGEDGGGGDREGGPCALPSELRRRLRSYLGRQRMKHIRNWKDLSHCMAAMRSGYWLLGTMLLITIMAGAFMFMAGQYEFLRPIDASAGGVATSLAADPTSSYQWGPDALAAWLAFWRPRASRTFNFDYLRVWGGRYGPDLAAGQWWRWVTSLLLHQNSLHLASNLALLLVLSTYLESLYGFWRVLPLWIVSGVAGNMVSALFESPCTLVVGSSGAVFGLLGAYMADAALNFESIPLLWLRLLGMAAVVALIVALQVTDHGGSTGPTTSHASHVGGFLSGLLLAFLVLPDFKARRANKVCQLLTSMGLSSHLPPHKSPAGRQLFSIWQRHRALLYALYGVAIVVLALILLGVPLYVYLRIFPRMDC